MNFNLEQLKPLLDIRFWLPFALIAAVVAIVVIITVKRMLVWKVQKVRDDLASQLAKIGPDGKPYPPHGRGICHVCRNAFEKVYFTPDGGRICPDCYDEACQTKAEA